MIHGDYSILLLPKDDFLSTFAKNRIADKRMRQRIHQLGFRKFRARGNFLRHDSTPAPKRLKRSIQPSIAIKFHPDV